MRTAFEFSPLYRSSVGFDRIFDLIENASRMASPDNWPPYDIVKLGDDDYRIAMAVAGFSSDELTITQEPNMLIVTGAKSDEESGQFLHRGIASRKFQQRFELADHVYVAGANLQNGLLTIDLKRELPEEMKPHRIEIASGGTLPKAETRRIASEKKAA